MIRKDIAQTIEDQPFPAGNVNNIQDYLQSASPMAIEKHCPKAKPSAYAKKWWTQDLTVLRKKYTRARNAARSHRRMGWSNPTLEAEAKAARHDFHHEIKRKKKEHWLEFLHDTTNIWKASKYLDRSKASGFGRIESLQGQNNERIESKPEIAKELIKTFFPEPQTPEPVMDQPRSRGEQFHHQKVTTDEIEQASFAANPDKAPGRDGLTIRVWREVWPVLQQQICQLFSMSLNHGRLPDQWKIAKIIPLKKGGKDDWTLAKNYRPISLLPTLGKVLEAVIATRITFLAETEGLLPSTHFGARKQRSTIHALSYLVKKIFSAWRGKKTLSVVSFDVKGAYNGVAKVPLAARLRERRIPGKLVTWIEDFCTSRQASVMVNGYTSEVQAQTHGKSTKSRGTGYNWRLPDYGHGGC